MLSLRNCRPIFALAIFICLAVILAGCGGGGGLGRVLRRDIGVAELQQLIADGGDLLLIDVRTAEEYALSHIPGTVNMPHVDVATWGPTVNPDFRVVSICAAGGRSQIAADALIAQGHNVVYNLLGGMGAWDGDVDAFRQDITPAQLMDMMNAGLNMQLVDVRTAGEYATGHIPGTVNLPHVDVDTWAPTLVKQQIVVSICAAGGRSQIAADALIDKDFHKVYNMLGGMGAWTGPIE